MGGVVYINGRGKIGEKTWEWVGIYIIIIVILFIIIGDAEANE